MRGSMVFFLSFFAAIFVELENGREEDAVVWRRRVVEGMAFCGLRERERKLWMSGDISWRIEEWDAMLGALVVEVWRKR